MIAFLHTSKIHIDRFEKLAQKINSKIETKHFVNEQLLEAALKIGNLDSANFTKDILKIQTENPELIICTCSTYGPLCEKFENVKRIDEPIVQYLVSKFTKIGLAFTAISTKAVSRKLIEATAKKQNRRIEIFECDCTESWKYFEEGKMDEYEKSIAAQIKKINKSVEVVFLAQASMEGATDYLKDFEKEICSSPEFGVVAGFNPQHQKS